MITETTDNNGGKVLYDADCAFCSRWARRGERWFIGRGYRFEPLPADADEMKLITARGVTFGGADAIVELARYLWWTWPMWALSRVPGMMPLFRAGYRGFAANRYCLGGRCEIRPATSALPAVLLPVAALLWHGWLPAWVFMWVMVGAVVGGVVGLTGWRPRDGVGRVGPGLVKMMIGALLLWGVARWMPAPLGQGWVGMMGLVLMLHFGAVHCLLAVCGFEPIMREPLRARTLSEFWGERWNRVFPQMMRQLVFEPVRRWTSAPVALLAVFAVSGLLHELVISLPARGGYGLPTVYFLIQGVGLLVERKLRESYRPAFTWIVVVGPVYWLFHPPFIERVVLPMMRAVGAIN